MQKERQSDEQNPSDTSRSRRTERMRSRRM
jgi:hypothetical protein